MDPIYFGDYPETMRAHVGERLPQFLPDDISLLRGSVDFIGLNHYTSRWVTSQPRPNDPATSTFWDDQCISTSGTILSLEIEKKLFSWVFEPPFD